MKMKSVCIIGGGPAGIMSALQIKNHKIIIFEKNTALSTLLCTGGSSCNLSYNEPDIEKFIEFYPHGKKFLKTVFGIFGMKETRNFFDKIGISTYIREDNRIFPQCNSAATMRTIILDNLTKNQNVNIIREEVMEITAKNGKFNIKSNIDNYCFDFLIIATGGNRLNPKNSGYKFASSLGHNIIKLSPSACGLKIKEDYLLEANGVKLKNLEATVFINGKRNIKILGDLAIDKTGISSTIAYTVSSYFTYCDFEYTNFKIRFKLFNSEFNKSDFDKKIIDVLSNIIDVRLVKVILSHFSIDGNIIIKEIDKNKIRELLHYLKFFELNVAGKIYISESTTAGGIDLSEINPKTMESKICKNLYFCGEVIDVDGLIGGFNLQNCWSTGYIAGQSLNRTG